MKKILVIEDEPEMRRNSDDYPPAGELSPATSRERAPRHRIG